MNGDRDATRPQLTRARSWNQRLRLTGDGSQRILGSVAGFFRYVSVLFLTVACAVGNVGVCAGWQPTPESRMACCAKDGVCPMRKAAASDRKTPHVVTQAEADSCCAASERDDATPSAGASSTTSAIVLLPVTFPPLVAAPSWRPPVRPSAAPSPPRSVPRHVLLSVFLV